MRYRRVLPFIVMVVGVFAIACGSSVLEAEPTPRIFPTVAPPDGVSHPLVEPPPTIREGDVSTANVPKPRLTFGWKTDFSKHTVPFTEIRSGGPSRDGIPPIDAPKFIHISNPPKYMKDNEPVISLEIGGDARAYPLAILISHEIVNDEFDGVPVTITYCPLCNSAIVFDRRVDGRVLDFSTTGLLRNSDLIMYDRQTESWWQQITGNAIVGELSGAKLTFIPAPTISWSQFAESFPHGKVLSRDTGSKFNYDLPPYSDEDGIGNLPSAFKGDIDPRLDALERVVALSFGNEHIAYPFALLNDHPVINDTIAERDLVIFYASDTLSAFAGFGYSLTPRRVVGSTGVYDPTLDGQKLTFKIENSAIVDEKTGSKWTILGEAVDGPLTGSKLEPIVHANHFWFAWAAFYPETDLRTAKELAE